MIHYTMPLFRIAAAIAILAAIQPDVVRAPLRFASEQALNLTGGGSLAMVESICREHPKACADLLRRLIHEHGTATGSTRRAQGAAD